MITFANVLFVFGCIVFALFHCMFMFFIILIGSFFRDKKQTPHERIYSSGKFTLFVYIFFAILMGLAYIWDNVGPRVLGALDKILTLLSPIYTFLDGILACLAYLATKLLTLLFTFEGLCLIIFIFYMERIIGKLSAIRLLLDNSGKD